MRKVDQNIIIEILRAIKQDKRDRSWPVHIVSQAARIAGKVGNLINTAEILKYEDVPECNKDLAETLMRRQAVEVAAAAIRFIENIDAQQKEQKIDALTVENLLEENHVSPQQHY